MKNTKIKIENSLSSFTTVETQVRRLHRWEDESEETAWNGKKKRQIQREALIYFSVIRVCILKEHMGTTVILSRIKIKV